MKSAALVRRSPALFAVLLCLGQILHVAAVSFPPLEASFQVNGLATDPFDYTVTDIQVSIGDPNTNTVELPAFFDGGITWRVRHTPLLPGHHQITGISLNGSPLAFANLQPASWNVSGPAKRGYIELAPGTTNRFQFSDGRRFFPVGHNVAWDTSATVSVVNLTSKLGTAHENWARVWMNHWDGKNLDWPNSGPTLPLGELNLDVARKWDSIVTAAEDAGVFFQLVLQHHGQYSTTVDPNWNFNPYNTANGGFLTSPTQFFTDPTARALTKRKIRYAIARWGYSTAIMAWELFNEVQFTEAAQNGQWSIVGTWHDEMAQFIRAQDPYHHLITTSSELDAPIWDEMDYYQHHDYTADYITALADPAGVPPGEPVKPVFGGESGRNFTAFYGQHAPVWAGLMGNQAGLSQPWYWDRMDSERCYSLMRAVQDFVLSSGLPEREHLVKSSPAVATGQNGSLTFAPGGGWSDATQDTFTVGSAPPAGIGTLPSYLQGNFHRQMTPNGYTFNVNYAEPGTFSVQILIIAASGAGLQIFLDDVLANFVSFPATGSDVSTNFTLTINLPAGAHSIRLWNPGQDWVNLGNITLDPYVSVLGAYQIGDSSFAAVWLWHRDNIYSSSASGTASGSFPLAGLSPGPYRATWWDTFAGQALTNFTLSVANTNPVNIQTPDILRSVIFFAAPEPQISVTPPLLTRTMGSNSPPLELPLTITNSGGLPATYSLCVTGANLVNYVAHDSSQTGGPVFNWRDISGIGENISATFTQLASPKTARDEGIAGPIDIGFDFPFFSGAQSPGIYSQVYVSPNGFVTFSPFVGDRSVNTSLPNVSAPTNLVALFWDDLDVVVGSSARAVYVDRDPLAGTFTVQYNNVRFKGTTSTATCQLILKTTGEILLQYRTQAVANSCTIGLQNQHGDAGLQVAFNQNYLQTNFAIRLTPTKWLGLSSNAGLIPQLSGESVNIMLDPGGLAFGNYSVTLLVKTDDPVASLLTLPVSVEVSPIGTWRQTFFGTAEDSGSAADSADFDLDDILNIFEYAFATDPTIPNAWPVTYEITGDHLTMTFKRTHPAPPDISYLFEVAESPSGPWESGPAFTTINVTDNLDGTETVIVTDNTPVSSASTHYARIRISRP